jgi:hypothetical protein
MQAGFEIVVGALAAVLAAAALLAGRVIVLLWVEQMAAICQKALAGISVLCTVGADIRIAGHGTSLPHLAETSLQRAVAMSASESA